MHPTRWDLRTRHHDPVWRLVDDRAQHVATVDDIDQPAIDDHVDVDNDIDDEQHDHDHRADHRADHGNDG